jgi:hypothetical protein
MDEFDFDSWPQWTLSESYSRTRAMTRAISFSKKLWGDEGNLKRQLSAPSPAIPEGLGIEELRFLERAAAMVLKMGDRIPVTLWTPGHGEIFVGGQRWTLNEARYEIVRRAIESLGDGTP